jgi:cytochrome P450
LTKSSKPVSPGEVNIIHSNDADHSRMRRLTSHAFSEKALREQEFVLKSYVDLLIDKLQGFTDSGAPADLVKWYNFVIFDMIGELAFGQPFGCLQTTEYHFFVSILFQRLKMAVWLRIMQDIPALKKLFKYIVPKKVKEQSAMMVGYSADTTRTRIAKGALEEKKDFLSYMLKAKDEKGLSEAEIISNARILVIAGSETTATLLSGTKYWLLKSPEAYRKVTEEVRKTFASEEDISVQKVTSQLPYMMACLEEGFRMYPPVPSCLPRRTRVGTGITKIDGYEVPEDVSFIPVISFPWNSMILHGSDPQYIRLPSAYTPPPPIGLQKTSTKQICSFPNDGSRLTPLYTIKNLFKTTKKHFCNRSL